jgi:hypothetical protein
VEREVVLGDLAETDRDVWHALGDVLGLAARRQLSLWRITVRYERIRVTFRRSESQYPTGI